MSDPNSYCWTAIIGNNSQITTIRFGTDLSLLEISAGIAFSGPDRLLTDLEKIRLIKTATKYLALWGVNYMEESGDVIIYDAVLLSQEGIPLGAISIPMQYADGNATADNLNSFFLISVNDQKIYRYYALTDPNYMRNLISTISHQ
jgi:hypothetical protein